MDGSFLVPWMVLVGGVSFMVNYVNERDLSLLKNQM